MIRAMCSVYWNTPFVMSSWSRTFPALVSPAALAFECGGSSGRAKGCEARSSSVMKSPGPHAVDNLLVVEVRDKDGHAQKKEGRRGRGETRGTFSSMRGTWALVERRLSPSHS